MHHSSHPDPLLARASPAPPGAPLPASVYQQAIDAGAPVITDPGHPLDPRAARLLPHPLPDGMDAVPLAVAGDVLSVACPDLPSPAGFRALEAAAGCLVTVCLAPADVYASLHARHLAMRGLAPADPAVPGVGPGPDPAPPPSPPLAMDVVLREAVDRDASDVHLSVARPPILRIDGDLVPSVDDAPLARSDLDAAALWLAGTTDIDAEYETTVSAAGSRWRVSLYRQRHGLAVAMRRIPATIPRLEDLGVPAAVAPLAALRSGLVIVCGPTGSGKSTTLAGLVGLINRTRSVHVITIEDPVEYQHTSVKALIHQREVGPDTGAFADALRAAMRQDPDVILVGELRDLETMRTAIAAAETGHLVLTTVHAGSAQEAYSRIVDAFPANERDSVRSLLAVNTRAVLAQQLLPTLGGGRSLAVELLIASPAVRACVREGRLHEIRTILETGGAAGMTTMDRSLAGLVAAGRVDPAVALERAEDPGDVTAQLARLGRDPGGWA